MIRSVHSSRFCSLIARASWGDTAAWQEYERKSARRTPEQEKLLSQGMMNLMVSFGQLKHLSPDAPEVAAQVGKLRDYITEHYYDCTDDILRSLGAMYAGGGSMTANIDKAGGEGTGRFACRAIEAYVASR